MKVSNLFVDADDGKSKFDSQPIYKKVLVDKLARRQKKVRQSAEKDMQEFDIVPVTQENTKTIKTLQFELEMMISSGL